MIPCRSTEGGRGSLGEDREKVDGKGSSGREGSGGKYMLIFSLHFHEEGEKK